MFLRQSLSAKLQDKNLSGINLSRVQEKTRQCGRRVNEVTEEVKFKGKILQDTE